MTTGGRLKLRRKEMGMSAETLAELLGVSPATIYRYENGGIEKIPGARLKPIANALNTTPAYLMGWEDAPTEKEAPTPKEDERNINIIKIAGRDGSFTEKRLTDEQIKAVKLMIDQLPDVDDDL